MARKPRTPRERSPAAPGRSGPKVIAITSALVLIFLGVLWYASFVALKVRDPDRAFFAQDSWTNDTLSLYVNDLDVSGEVALDSLTAKVVAQDRTVLFDGALNRTVQNGNWSLTITIGDNDGSGTLTKNDDLNITTAPEGTNDNLLLTTVYLYSNGREWSHFPIPLV